MTTKIAINGFGRIGRLVLRTLLARHREELTVVAINDMADLKTNAHLFRYDTTYGIFPGTIEMGEGVLRIDGQNIAVLNLKEPARLPWRQLGVDIVIEATGVFTDAAHVRGHLDAGAKKAIITAPATDEDITLVLGVNDTDYDPSKHHIVSNASCTTNCLAPVAKVLHDSFGIEHGLDDYHSLLYQRPAHFGSHAQGSAPGARRGDEYRAHEHRRGEGHRPGHAGAKGQIARPVVARADGDGFYCRSGGQSKKIRPRRRHQRRVEERC